MGANLMSQLTLNADTTGYVTLSVATTVSSYTFQWPSAAPTTNGQLLASTTAGVGSWTTNTFPSTAAAGTVLAAATANTISATATPTLGVAGTTAGTLALSGVTSGTVTLQSSAAAGSYTYTFTNSGVNVNVGYLEVPQNSQGNGYTTVLSDSGKHLYFSAGGATITIAANGSVAYPLGTVLTFINMNGSSCSIAISSDTMYLAGTGTTGTRALAQYGMATAIKLTSTTWLISGTGLT
jgi:hypothetical protein